MPHTPKSSRTSAGRKKGVIYVSLYRGEPLSKLSEQIVACLQMEAVTSMPTIEIYGDIEDPQMSVTDISLSYPPYELIIVHLSPHNGKWSGFRLLATKQAQTEAGETREQMMRSARHSGC